MRSSLIVLAIVLATLRVVQAALAHRRAEAGRRRGGREAGQRDHASGRFAEWRYYGFSSRAPEADASVAEPQHDVASSPAIGSVVTTLPGDCVNVEVDGCVYYQCGSVWYQRQYNGSNVTYVVTRAP